MTKGGVYAFFFFFDAGMYEVVGLQRIRSFILFTNSKKQIVGSLVAHCTQGICKNKNAQIRDYLKGPNNLLNFLKPQSQYKGI